ncbi:hypothetical protein [Hahella sp. HN01]|uniref:hypothetical protein n=1 Tax=Hahella sp. HN01 TaxID=2847262 RepID=UPI001C1EB654|nr:hypothetical protein [Hahella sp. HN01]MBU6956002.1 hypothetical protein [Hahella sp. HN01]
MYKSHITTAEGWLALPEFAVPGADSSAGFNRVIVDVEKVSFCVVSKEECELAGLDAEPIPGGRRVLPIISTRQQDRVKIYRLPLDLTSWVIMVISLISLGRKLFPSRVEFKVHEGQRVAKIETLTKLDELEAH